MNNYSDYLEHHGILGQKWGVRRYQNEDGTLTKLGKAHYAKNLQDAKKEYKQAKREYNDAYKDAYRHNKPFSLSRDKRMETQARWETAGEKAQALGEAKQKYKLAKNQSTEDQMREKVKKYNKIYDEAVNAQDIADEYWAKSKEAYHELAKTPIGRLSQKKKALIGKGSDAAMKYLELQETANETSNYADEKTREMQAAYHDLGKNWYDRVSNAVRYR